MNKYRFFEELFKLYSDLEFQNFDNMSIISCPDNHLCHLCKLKVHCVHLFKRKYPYMHKNILFFLKNNFQNILFNYLHFIYYKT